MVISVIYVTTTATELPRVAKDRGKYFHLWIHILTVAKFALIGIQ